MFFVLIERGASRESSLLNAVVKVLRGRNTKAEVQRPKAEIQIDARWTCFFGIRRGFGLWGFCFRISARAHFCAGLSLIHTSLWRLDHPLAEEHGPFWQADQATRSGSV